VSGAVASVGIVVLLSSLAAGCVVPEGEERQRALWDVSNGTTKKEIMRLAGEPDEITSPAHCESVNGVKEEMVYRFEDKLLLFGRGTPRLVRYFCLDQGERVVDCCGFIEF
jgi:hypothetical protein